MTDNVEQKYLVYFPENAKGRSRVPTVKQIPLAYMNLSTFLSDLILRKPVSTNPLKVMTVLRQFLCGSPTNTLIVPVYCEYFRNVSPDNLKVLISKLY